MSCGTPEFRFPDEWMTAERSASKVVRDTHINKAGRLVDRASGGLERGLSCDRSGRGNPVQDGQTMS
jgi:hypothetical protein